MARGSRLGELLEPLGARDPRRIGPYRLRGRLGAGGMGQVFLGADRGGDLVAVKVVHPGLAHDERFRQRFRREVEVSRRVTGPWVAAVVGADPDAETPWLATQYVAGPSLGSAVEERGPLDAGAVRGLAQGLAAALAAVHDAGVVHRDLKPSNVLLGPDRPRLIDFGISRAVDGTRMTSTGMVVGTPAFMSPEQIAGQEVGPASDVFSLGAVLAYAATGRSPFGDHSPVVLMLRITAHEPDLAGVPAELRGPLAACLAKRPEDRPTPAQLGGMLGAPPTLVVAAPAVDGVSRRVGPGIRRRALLIALGAAVIVPAGGYALATALEAPRPLWTVDVPWDVAVAALDEGTLLLYGHDGGGRLLALDAATGAQRWLAPGRSLPEGLGEAAVLTRDGDVLVLGTAAAVLAFDRTTGAPRWEMAREVSGLSTAGLAVADGIAAAATGEGLVAVATRTGERIWTGDLGLGAGYTDVAVANGVCFTSTYSALNARDLRTGRFLWSGPADGEVSRFAAAGGVAVVETDGGVVRGLDAATGAERWRSGPLASAATSWRSFHVAGDRVVALGEDQAGNGVLEALDPAAGTVTWSWSRPEWHISTALLRVDGLLLVATPGGAQRAYDLGTGAERWVHETAPGDADRLVAAGPGVAYLHSPYRGRLAAVVTV